MNNLEEAVKIIKQGGIVIFPTDTAFGIGCRMDDEKAIERLFKIRKSVSIMRGFTSYLIGAFVLVAIAALQYIWYDALQDAGVPYLQIIYISHFLFYGALSLMFLAFQHIANLGGMYSQIGEVGS